MALPQTYESVVEDEWDPPSPPIQLPEQPEASLKSSSSNNPFHHTTPYGPSPQTASSSQPRRFSSPNVPNSISRSPTSHMQMFAKLLLLAHIPAQITFSVMIALFQQRQRLLQSGSSDDLFDIASSQLNAVLHRCQRGFLWIELEMPEWVERGRESVRSLPQTISQAVHVGESYITTRYDSPQTQSSPPPSFNDQTTQEHHRMAHQQQGHRYSQDSQTSETTKLILTILVLLGIHSLFSMQFTFLRWAIKPRIPVWVIIAAFLMRGRKVFLQKRRGHFRTGRVFEERIDGGKAKAH